MGYVLTRRSVMVSAMLLVAVAVGVSTLLQRLMEPSEFIIFQDLFFASFNNVDGALLGVSALIIALVCGGVWRSRHVLDVLLPIVVLIGVIALVGGQGTPSWL